MPTDLRSKAFLLIMFSIIILSIAYGLFLYSQRSNQVLNTTNPFVAENYYFSKHENLEIDLSHCRTVYNYSNDDPPLPVLEYNCNNTYFNVLKLYNPSKLRIRILVVQIIEYRTKIPSKYIRHYVTENGDIYIILYNFTKIKLLPVMSKAVKVDEGGLIVLSKGDGAVKILFEARYSDGKDRDYGILCTRCEVSYVSLK